MVESNFSSNLLKFKNKILKNTKEANITYTYLAVRMIKWRKMTTAWSNCQKLSTKKIWHFRIIREDERYRFIHPDWTKNAEKLPFLSLSNYLFFKYNSEKAKPKSNCRIIIIRDSCPFLFLFIESGTILPFFHFRPSWSSPLNPPILQPTDSHRTTSKWYLTDQ